MSYQKKRRTNTLQFQLNKKWPLVGTSPYNESISQKCYEIDQTARLYSIRHTRRVDLSPHYDSMSRYDYDTFSQFGWLSRHAKCSISSVEPHLVLFHHQKCFLLCCLYYVMGYHLQPAAVLWKCQRVELLAYRSSLRPMVATTGAKLRNLVSPCKQFQVCQ